MNVAEFTESLYLSTFWCTVINIITKTIKYTVVPPLFMSPGSDSVHAIISY